MISVDGRTDIEKLRELLSEPEQDHLDFKANIDLEIGAMYLISSQKAPQSKKGYDSYRYDMIL